MNDLILRPLLLRLRDTEIYDPESPTAELSFFVRPVASSMLFDKAHVKTNIDTDLHESKVLPVPMEFSVLGFSLRPEAGANSKDIDALFDDGALAFYYNTRRYADFHLLEMPVLWDVPSLERQILALMGLAEYHPEWFGLTTEQLNSLSVIQLREHIKLWRGTESSETHRPFNIGRHALKIRATDRKDEFYTEVVWNKPPKVSKKIRLVCFIHGIKWSVV